MENKKVIFNEEMLELVNELFDKFADEPEEIVIFMQILTNRIRRHNLKKTWNYSYLTRYPAFKKFLRDEQQRRATSRYLKKKKESED